LALPSLTFEDIDV